MKKLKQRQTRNLEFGYADERMSIARRVLMLPHSRGEAESVAEAFFSCSLAFNHLNPQHLDDQARRWMDKIQEFMDTTGIEDTAGRGTWLVKAEQLTTDQKIELSQAVDELAYYLKREYWGIE